MVSDLAPSLLKVADRRIAENGWSNVHTVHADATHYQPPGQGVDVVTFSYSLTMIPDWFAAHRQRQADAETWRLDRRRGLLCESQTRGRGLPATRLVDGSLWPTWFGLDNVFPSPDHLPYLNQRFERAGSGRAAR